MLSSALYRGLAVCQCTLHFGIRRLCHAGTLMLVSLVLNGPPFRHAADHQTTYMLLDPPATSFIGPTSGQAQVKHRSATGQQQAKDDQRRPECQRQRQRNRPTASLQINGHAGRCFYFCIFAATCPLARRAGQQLRTPARSTKALCANHTNGNRHVQFCTLYSQPVSASVVRWRDWTRQVKNQKCPLFSLNTHLIIHLPCSHSFAFPRPFFVPPLFVSHLSNSLFRLFVSCSVSLAF